MKNWLVTGSSRGIGLEIARAALAAGERVTATGRDPDGLAEAIDSDHGDLTCLPLDVRDREQIAATIKGAEEAMGSIDVLVNNAGYSQMGIFEEVSPDAFEAQYATNVFGVANVLRAALPTMRRAGSGHVINIASLNGIVPLKGSSAYSSSKSAVIGLSEALAAEVEQFGIKVTAVCPGAIRTDFLDDNSMQWVDESIRDYAELAGAIRGRYDEMNHNQPGDPGKVAAAVVELSRRDDPPMRFVLGSAAYEAVDGAYRTQREELEADEKTSRSADFDS